MASTNGFLLVDKPAGPSSHDVVKQVRKVARNRQVGHAGTLDPAASGLLAVAIGQCTKLLQFLVLNDKRYRFELVLGTQTESDDDTSDIVETRDFSHVTECAILDQLAEFTGLSIEQVPPNISAVRIDGRRAHRLTRRGVDFEMPSREVDIYALDLLAYDPESGVARLEIECGSGTYVRALCRDLGHALGTCAHARNIYRTAVGHFSVDRAIPLDQLTRATLHDYLMTDQEMLGCNLKVDVDDTAAWRLGMGQKVFVEIPDFDPAHVTEHLSLIDELGELIGVGRVRRVDSNGIVVAPRKILKPRYGTERRPSDP